MAPRRPARPAVRALPIVACRRTSCVRPGPGSGSLTAAMRQNIFIAWNTLCTSLPCSCRNPARAARLMRHVVDWGDAALEFEVAELIKHDACIDGCHAINLLAGDPDAVDNVQLGPQQADVIHVADQRAVMVRE